MSARYPWFDDVDVTVELSTAGDYATPPPRTDVPLYPAGAGGIAQSWQQWLQNSAAAGLITYAVVGDAQRITIPVSGATAPSNGWRFGVRYDIPAIVGHRYLFGATLRKDAASTAATIGVRLSLRSSSGGEQANYNASETPGDAGTYRLMIASGAIPSNIATLSMIPFGVRTDDNLGATVWASNAWWIDLDAPATAPVYNWRDITCDVRSIDMRHGRQRYLQRMDVGTMTLELDNTDGDYSYADPHPFGLRPGRIVRVSATSGGATFPLAFHLLDEIDGTVALDGTARTRFTCHDISALGGNTNPPDITTTTGPNVPAFTLTDRIRLDADLLGITGYQVVDDPTPAQAITPSGRSLRDDMGVTADTARGVLFADQLGRLTFYNYLWPVQGTYGTQVQATFHAEPSDPYVRDPPGAPLATWDDATWDDATWPADVPSDVPDDDNTPNGFWHAYICPNSVQDDWSRGRVINRVRLANAGQITRVYDDPDSQRQYGIQDYPRLDLVGVDGTPLDALAARILKARRDARRRVHTLTYTTTAQNPAHWRFTLTVFMGFLVRVRYFNAKTSWRWQQVTYVQSVQHTITPGRWTVTLQLDDADRVNR